MIGRHVEHARRVVLVQDVLGLVRERARRDGEGERKECPEGSPASAGSEPRWRHRNDRTTVLPQGSNCFHAIESDVELNHPAG
jgi:hypothetical protein